MYCNRSEESTPHCNRSVAVKTSLFGVVMYITSQEAFANPEEHSRVAQNFLICGFVPREPGTVADFAGQSWREDE